MTEDAPKDEGGKEGGGLYSKQIGTAIKGLTPASTGWVLAIVIIVTVIQVSNLLENNTRSVVLASFIEGMHANSKESTRRHQEVIKDLVNTIEAQADRCAGILRRQHNE